MKIKDIIGHLEVWAPLPLQENYDNSGLLIGNSDEECTGILVSLDATETIVEEAIKKNCNLIVTHHPLIFKGLKKLNGKNYVERTVIGAIKHNIAIYAIHTNLDNVIHGVNGKIAEKLNLQNCTVLLPKENTLKKLVTFCPSESAEAIRNILFANGAGAIGNYGDCSFSQEGKGTFKALEGSNPYVGEVNKRHVENETRIEVIFPAGLEKNIIATLKKAHPYEEVAYYITLLDNVRYNQGSGLIGKLAKPVSESELLTILKEKFHLSIIKHTSFTKKEISSIAVCGGSGIFLLPHAMAAGAQVYITGDIKYHEFFDAEGEILLADIGHYESEQFTVELIAEFLQQKFLNFAVLKTEISTNPVIYYT